MKRGRAGIRWNRVGRLGVAVALLLVVIGTVRPTSPGWLPKSSWRLRLPSYLQLFPSPFHPIPVSAAPEWYRCPVCGGCGKHFRREFRARLTCEFCGGTGQRFHAHARQP